MEIHSGNIKTVLMYYYRFKRQFIACDEVKTDCNELSDILVMTKKEFIEIEIKTSKSDLINGEKSKDKHKKLNEKRLVNKFYICVPTELVEDAKLWIAQTNINYGLIEFRTEIAKGICYDYETLLLFSFDAKSLQPTFSEDLKTKIIKRLSSALTNEYIRRVK